MASSIHKMSHFGLNMRNVMYAILEHGLEVAIVATEVSAEQHQRISFIGLIQTKWTLGIHLLNICILIKLTHTSEQLIYI